MVLLGAESYVHAGKDGYLAALNKGEIVLNNKEANEMRSLGFGTRDSMLDLARMSDMGVDKGGKLVTVTNDNSILSVRTEGAKQTVKRAT